ncbi:hypothetical protein Rsub_03684 [Raphidocelis subcapitata]|uniref:Alginate lyase domain-containing protein n=1 Tax=Raphidocelis subcapitata TaxID=307507 RepID=A0A2V0NZ13_9CHLO|nr:hypothetical protein Rsub_03684 [Raphidocelis subcapitata]|eukprot:GBF90830.1 hypothetical protein Rsub_03684 [Raphidocelis subcapitata]
MALAGRIRPVWVGVSLLLLAAAVHGADTQRPASDDRDVASALQSCQGEWQITMCGQIPLDSSDELVACCMRYAHGPPRMNRVDAVLLKKRGQPAAPAAAASNGSALASSVRAAASDMAYGGWTNEAGPAPADGPEGARARAAAVLESGPRPVKPEEAAPATGDDIIEVERPDLEDNGANGIDFLYGKCTKQLLAEVPVFSRSANGTTEVHIESQPVPELRPAVVEAVKARAMRAAPRAQRAKARSLRTTANSRRSWVNKASGFIHPGATYAGPEEIAHLQMRLEAGIQPQIAARRSLLTRPADHKYGIQIPVNAAPEGYGGPYPMEKFQADYYGYVRDLSICPSNYPERAPSNLCGHISLVEIDAPMSYRHAMAYAATGDARHAEQAMEIIQAWATTNKEFGPKDRNGPLEAAWSCAPMARSVDLLRASWPGFTQSHLDTFMGWVDSQLMPQMDHYIDEATPSAVAAGRNNTYGNWHASVSDCMMAIGVLSDNRPRYEKGLELYRKTVQEYFRWGRGEWSKGRIIGESTETLRDIYHTLFGLGSLIQAAETAWGQNDDVYGEHGHVLAAAMELHARIISADELGDDSYLPPGFKFFSAMPPPPENCTWKWDFETQLWSSYDANRTKCSELHDGYKYAVGVTYLPNGFELGYNHFVGRLGMKLPETAALLERHPVDWFTFSWGLATLTHADTAKDLWRAGLSRPSLCATEPSRRPFLSSPNAAAAAAAIGGAGIAAPTLTVSHGGGQLSVAGLGMLEGADPGVLSFGVPSVRPGRRSRARGRGHDHDHSIFGGVDGPASS